MNEFLAFANAHPWKFGFGVVAFTLLLREFLGFMFFTSEIQSELASIRKLLEKK